MESGEISVYTLEKRECDELSGIRRGRMSYDDDNRWRKEPWKRDARAILGFKQFALLPQALLEDTKITVAQKIFYCYLSLLCGKRGETNACDRYLGECIQIRRGKRKGEAVSASYVQKCLKALAQEGYIKKNDERYDSTGGRRRTITIAKRDGEHFCKVYDNYLRDKRLSGSEVLLLAYFDWRDMYFERGCNEHTKAIAKATGMSTATVGRCIKKLGEYGYIDFVAIKGKGYRVAVTYGIKKEQWQAAGANLYANATPRGYYVIYQTWRACLETKGVVWKEIQMTMGKKAAWKWWEKNAKLPDFNTLSIAQQERVRGLLKRVSNEEIEAAVSSYFKDFITRVKEAECVRGFMLPMDERYAVLLKEFVLGKDGLEKWLRLEVAKWAERLPYARCVDDRCAMWWWNYSFRAYIGKVKALQAPDAWDLPLKAREMFCNSYEEHDHCAIGAFIIYAMEKCREADKALEGVEEKDRDRTIVKYFREKHISLTGFILHSLEKYTNKAADQWARRKEWLEAAKAKMAKVEAPKVPKSIAPTGKGEGIQGASSLNSVGYKVEAPKVEVPKSVAPKAPRKVTYEEVVAYWNKKKYEMRANCLTPCSYEELCEYEELYERRRDIWERVSQDDIIGAIDDYFMLMSENFDHKSGMDKKEWFEFLQSYDRYLIRR